MIYTLTLNPALDRTLWVDKIKTDDPNRIIKEERYAGGKGIDVSKVLNTLGAGSTVLGFIGGYAGEELSGRLLNEGVDCDFVRISGETRTNVVINDMSGGAQFLFSGSGPEITPVELARIIKKVRDVEDPEIIIIGGSLPPGVNPGVYREMIEIAVKRGASVLLDSDGDALKEGISGQPDFIKPNIHELSRLVGRPLSGREDIIGAAAGVVEKGVKGVLVSMGAEGVLFVGRAGRYLAGPPPVKVVNTVGAGDSAVAGFVYGLIQGKTIKEALAYGVAAGSATAMMPGTALCRKADFLKLAPRVRVSDLKL